ncbi:MAG: hypothetical protein AABY16_00540 [Nanoarchaeota archaeon]|mgnify:CR=1 FL=1
MFYPKTPNDFRMISHLLSAFRQQGIEIEHHIEEATRGYVGENPEKARELLNIAERYPQRFRQIAPLGFMAMRGRELFDAAAISGAEAYTPKGKALTQTIAQQSAALTDLVAGFIYNQLERFPEKTTLHDYIKERKRKAGLE